MLAKASAILFLVRAEADREVASVTIVGPNSFRTKLEIKVKILVAVWTGLKLETSSLSDSFILFPKCGDGDWSDDPISSKSS